jgi:transcription-repair coupling factor (superfamily II helicase)
MNFVDAFRALPTVRRVLDGIRRGSHRRVGGLWGGSAALLIAAARTDKPRPILVVTADDDDASVLADEIATFLGRAPLVLPRQEVDVDGQVDPITLGRRIHVLREAAAAKDPVVVAGFAALLQAAPSFKSLSKGHVTLAVGAPLDVGELLRKAESAQMRRVPLVVAPGEISVRGDVVDLFALGAAQGLRIEIVDDVVDSLRTFDPSTQLSQQIVERTDVVLGITTADAGVTDPITHVARPDLLVVVHEPLKLDDRIAVMQSFGGEAAATWLRFLETTATASRLDVSSLPSQDLDLKILSAGSAVGSGEADPVGRLRTMRGLDGSVVILCRTEDEHARLTDIFAHKSVDLEKERVTLRVGAIGRGFRIPDLRLTIVSNVEFYGVPASARVVERREIPSRAIKSFFELGPGDVVVHAVHGIARFEGIELVERGDAAEDHLRLTFQDEVVLLVPGSKVHLVQKYVGSGDAHPKLDKLGGRGFQKRKEEVQQALFDMAADLLDVQSAREKAKRHSYPPDPLEQAFLDDFPFQDTPDQATSWKEIAAELERDTPMDRLLCGDVGFGKTEIALRAAFRVAIHGRQVAVLVPTTLLADQHAQTFRRRFEPHGLRVEMLSRYRTASERKQLVADLSSGAIDLLVGTHAILAQDVDWHDLALVVVDEEQRFGVRHKEHLKRLRRTVDVLTLSATPIPRTLHASLLGIRSISTLATPPPGRQDVETRLAYREPRVLQEAVERELSRGGQVFVLHNRISGLDALQREIERLVPRARVAIGHGQMTQAQMEATVRRFVRGEIDVLVSTSIVENGLDIPRANTILVDRAEMFGLAELHQLRGRVGRSDVKAHCLLLLDRAHPPTDEAKKRLKAIEEFSGLGAGFAIAIKDLEIRGAGNLLGPQQSGHIAAVGYDMYCQLLRGAVGAAKERRAAASSGRAHASVPPPRAEVTEVDVDLRLQAFVPQAFVADAKGRLELLREMDGAIDPASKERIRASLEDRFGKLPDSLLRLLDVFLLKHLLMDQDVLGVQWTGEDRVVVRHRRGEPLGGAWLDAFVEMRAVEAGKTHLMLGRRKGGEPWTAERVLHHLLGALLGQPVRSMISRLR